jgi:hypothetical protein
MVLNLGQFVLVRRVHISWNVHAKARETAVKTSAAGDRLAVSPGSRLQPLEARMPQHAILGKLGECDLGLHLRFNPDRVGRFRGFANGGVLRINGARRSRTLRALLAVKVVPALPA